VIVCAEKNVTTNLTAMHCIANAGVKISGWDPNFDISADAAHSHPNHGTEALEELLRLTECCKQNLIAKNRDCADRLALTITANIACHLQTQLKYDQPVNVVA